MHDARSKSLISAFHGHFALTITVFLRMLKSSRVKTEVALVNAPHVSIAMLSQFASSTDDIQR